MQHNVVTENHSAGYYVYIVQQHKWLWKYCFCAFTPLHTLHTKTKRSTANFVVIIVCNIKKKIIQWIVLEKRNILNSILHVFLWRTYNGFILSFSSKTFCWIDKKSRDLCRLEKILFLGNIKKQKLNFKKNVTWCILIEHPRIII